MTMNTIHLHIWRRQIYQEMRIESWNLITKFIGKVWLQICFTFDWNAKAKNRVIQFFACNLGYLLIANVVV